MYPRLDTCLTFKQWSNWASSGGQIPAWTGKRNGGLLKWPYLITNSRGLSRAFETLQPLNPISKHQNKFRMQRRTQNVKVKARYNSISSVDFFQFHAFFVSFLSRSSRNTSYGLCEMAPAIEMKTVRRRSLPSFFSRLSCYLSPQFFLSLPLQTPSTQASAESAIELRLCTKLVQVGMYDKTL